jgi:prepilin-type N-terminal cleavage/methylation domain-containing protein
MKGYTLIELLVVVAISAMLATIAVVYTNVAKHETTLSVESAKVADAVIQAKNLAIATYGSANPPSAPKVCGYGVSVNAAAGTYSIFAYAPLALKYPDLVKGGVLQFCPSLASTTAEGIRPGASPRGEMDQYSPSTWNVPLASDVRIAPGSNADALVFVLFYPPDPATLMSNDGVTIVTSTSRIYLATTDGNASTTVTVNGAGQITF